VLRVVERATEDEGNRPSLEDLAREGARRMLMAALDAEVTEYVAAHSVERDDSGRAMVVRNGRARTRTIVTGSGTVAVAAPRVNDRREDDDGVRQRFTSRILPPYMRRSPKVDEVLPILYLRGLSTGDFREAIPALLGEDAAGLSATTITRLTTQWEAEHRDFQQRDLSEREYVYVWCDGIHVNVRLEDDRVCLLIMLGARADGTKELIAVEDGYRESKESWEAVLRGLKKRGLSCAGGRGRRRRAGILECGARRVAGDARAALLGASPGQRARQAAQAPAGPRQAGTARDHGCRDAR